MTRSVRRRAPPVSAGQAAPVTLFKGGRYQPLSDRECDRIIDCAFDILQAVGVAGSPEWLTRRLLDRGAGQRDDGRLTIPRKLAEQALRRASRRVSLPGFDEDRGLDIGGGCVHIGTGGAAVQTLDSETGEYRDSTLADLYQSTRVLDACENVHYGIRLLVARDMPTPLDLDINTAFACLKATGKPIGVSFENAAHVAQVCHLFDLALGREGGFRRQPFCMGIIVHVVSPLKFSPEGVEIMRAAIEAGMPLQICTAGQAGATSPASLAGALAQGLAESMAGTVVVDTIKPGHACIHAFMPFISDLRTGAMTGGSGESALANAAAAQLLGRLEVPSTVAAGMTDSKVGDIQAGYEKGYSVVLAAQAGADMINLSVGMLGSIMVASPEALVIDNEMCGAVLRTVRGIEVRDEFLDTGRIDRVVRGEGHYLGEPQTLDLMLSEYVYPQLGDRRSVPDWVESGSRSIWQRAHRRVQDLLRQPPPEHLPRRAETAIRRKFDIRLTEEKT